MSSFQIRVGETQIVELEERDGGADLSSILLRAFHLCFFADSTFSTTSSFATDGTYLSSLEGHPCGVAAVSTSVPGQPDSSSSSLPRLSSFPSPFAVNRGRNSNRRALNMCSKARLLPLRGTSPWLGLRWIRRRRRKQMSSSPSLTFLLRCCSVPVGISPEVSCY